MAVRRDLNLNKALFERILRGISRGFRSFFVSVFVKFLCLKWTATKAAHIYSIWRKNNDLVPAQGFPPGNLKTE